MLRKTISEPLTGIKPATFWWPVRRLILKWIKQHHNYGIHQLFVGWIKMLQENFDFSWTKNEVNNVNLHVVDSTSP